MEDVDWEICNLWHDVKNGIGKHKIRLAINKDSKYRNTFCVNCHKSVMFERVNDSNDLQRHEILGKKFTLIDLPQLNNSSLTIGNKYLIKDSCGSCFIINDDKGNETILGRYRFDLTSITKIT